MGSYEIAEEAVSTYGFTAGHASRFQHGFHGVCRCQEPIRAGAA